MIGDKSFEFSTDQAITNASVRSTREIDLGPVMRSVGSGTPLYMVYTVTEAFTVGSGAPSLIIHNVLDILPAQTGVLTATFVGSSVQLFVSNGLSQNELFLGQQIVVPISPLSEAQRIQSAGYSVLLGAPAPWRYLGAFYQFGTGAFGAGKISCFMTARPPNPVKLGLFPDGISANA